jgi:hypothetical protein
MDSIDRPGVLVSVIIILVSIIIGSSMNSICKMRFHLLLFLNAVKCKPEKKNNALQYALLLLLPLPVLNPHSVPVCTYLCYTCKLDCL